MRLLALCLALAACGTTYAVPQATAPGPAAAPGPAPQAGARRAGDFRRVAARVEPAAEAMCREQAPGADCDFLIGLETDPKMPPNAFQTLERAGPPGDHRQRQPARRDAVRRRARLRPLPRGQPPHRRPHPAPAAAAGPRRAGPRRPRRRRRPGLRQPRLRRRHPPGDGRRRHASAPAPTRRATSSRPTPSAPTSPPAPASRPSAAPTSSAARRLRTPAARRSSPPTRARRSARPPSPASPPTSAPSRPPASSRPRAIAEPENRPPLHFGACNSPAGSLDTPSPQRTEPAGLAAPRENRQHDAGRVRARTHPVAVAGRSLTVLSDEGICGRFGSFRWTGCLHIGSLGGAPMMWVSASPFVGRLFPVGTDARRTMTFGLWPEGWSDVQRFGRQEGLRGGDFGPQAAKR